MTLTLDQQCNLDVLICKRYHTQRIASITGLPLEYVNEYRMARKKARHGQNHDRVKAIADPLLPALQAWRVLSPLIGDHNG